MEAEISLSQSLAKPVRIRSPKHLQWIRTLRCSVYGCTRQSTAHHLTCGPEPKARGLTAGDPWTVPLCDEHHLAGFPGSVHHAGDERAWWAARNIDPIALAQKLWARSPVNQRKR